MKENTEKDQTLTELFGAKNLMGHGPRLSSDDSFITCRIVQDIFAHFLISLKTHRNMLNYRPGHM